MRGIRDLGVTDTVYYSIDTTSVILLGVLTQLGDSWFLFLLASTFYIASTTLSPITLTRTEGAYLIAVVLTYIGLITLVKHILFLPRPTGATIPPAIETTYPFVAAITTSITTATGPGFPSGHALGSTMVYGTIALLTTAGTRTNRLLLGSGLIVLIGFTRIALGLHYLSDVLGGIILGVLVLLLLLWASNHGSNPRPIFITASVIGGLGVLVSSSPESIAALGGGMGGWISWNIYHQSIPHAPRNRNDVIFGMVLAVCLGLGFGVLYLVEPGNPGIFLASGILVGGTITVPYVSSRITENPVLNNH